MSVNISDTLTLLTGRRPTDVEIAEITRIIHGLGAEEYNIFVKVLLFLYYQTKMINDTPLNLKNTTNDILNKVQEVAISTARTRIDEYAAETTKTLSESVKNNSDKIASAITFNKIWKTILISGLLTLSVVVVTIYFFHDNIYKKGFEEGKQSASLVYDAGIPYNIMRNMVNNLSYYNDIIQMDKNGVMDNILKLKKAGLLNKDILNVETFKKIHNLYDQEGYNGGKNTLEEILSCKRKGWIIKKMDDGYYCFPLHYKNENNEYVTDGWKVP